MSKSCSVVPGRSYSGQYPRYNYEGLPDKMETRRFKVISVRDLKKEPLSEEAIALRPTLKRGRWLVTAIDLDKGQERSFYAERFAGVVELITDPSRAYIVVEYDRVQFSDDSAGSAIAFREGRRSGAIYGRLVSNRDFVTPVLSATERRQENT